jgi:hypothetical protein
MGHMVTNFYSHFKNRDLMNLFKRLCNQNQERKFNALWKVLNDLTTKNAHVQAREGSSSIPAPLQESSSRLFTCWIRDSPKEKWVLLYNNGGSHYGITTTNLAVIQHVNARGKDPSTCGYPGVHLLWVHRSIMLQPALHS